MRKLDLWPNRMALKSLNFEVPSNGDLYLYWIFLELVKLPAKNGKYKKYSLFWEKLCSELRGCKHKQKITADFVEGYPKSGLTQDFSSREPEISIYIWRNCCLEAIPKSGYTLNIFGENVNVPLYGVMPQRVPLLNIFGRIQTKYWKTELSNYSWCGL